MDALKKLKLLCLENAPESGDACAAALSPRMFSDKQLQDYLELNDGDVEGAAYQVLLLKSQSTQATLAGMTLPEQQNYYLRLAKRARKNVGGAIERADAP